MMTFRLLVLAGCVALSGCGAGRLDRRTRAVFAGATKVEVFRLDAKELFDAPRPRPEGQARFAGYLVTARGQDQGKDFADRLAEVLSDEKTYTDKFAKCFNPGVGFRVHKGEEVVDVLLCFECNNLYCGPPKKQPSENGSFRSSPRRADLVRLAKEALPYDKDIQALKDE